MKKNQYQQNYLQVFYEDELDVPLVFFNEVLEHVLRIDRIFRQLQRHLLLIGTDLVSKLLKMQELEDYYELVLLTRGGPGPSQ
ncbi:Dynein heavy chain 64C [Gryllus bimaculatus]|nr:Dynein heavy chain 64C [Gryllus bimaculatus]